jgi:hypothetical protein
MASSAEVVSPAENDWPLSNPWPWMITGLVLLAAAFLWVQGAGETLTPLRIGGIFLGLLAAGSAVAIRPGSGAVLASAGLAGLLGSFALYVPGHAAQWNSIRLVLAVVTAVAFLAALLMVMPRFWRRLIVSVLVVLHFLGILSAVEAAPPGPWLANVLWTYIYRPYLQFMYLNNAYHFYAPNPGPSYDIRFRIEYTTDPDTIRWTWKKVPRLDQDGWPEYTLSLQYQRRLALASLLAQSTQQVDSSSQFLVALRREKENLQRYAKGKPIIPRNPYPGTAQYVVPSQTALDLLSSYVRHVAYEFRQSHPDAEIRNIKVYRVEHKILSADEIKKGIDPAGWETYLPYFWGKYDADGELLDDKDPYLYWQMPILQVRPEQPVYFNPNTYMIAHNPSIKLPTGDPPRQPNPEEDHFSIDVFKACKTQPGEDYKILNYMYYHAGDPAWIRYPGENHWSAPRGDDRKLHRQ